MALKNKLAAGALKASAPVTRTGKSLIRNFTLGSLFRMGGFMGVTAGAHIVSAMQPKLPPIPAGAMITTGKRGIDGNNLNASGIGLSMYRNRRS